MIWNFLPEDFFVGRRTEESNKADNVRDFCLRMNISKSKRDREKINWKNLLANFIEVILSLGYMVSDL